VQRLSLAGCSRPCPKAIPLGACVSPSGALRAFWSRRAQCFQLYAISVTTQHTALFIPSRYDALRGCASISRSCTPGRCVWSVDQSRCCIRAESPPRPVHSHHNLGVFSRCAGDWSPRRLAQSRGVRDGHGQELLLPNRITPPYCGTVDIQDRRYTAYRRASTALFTVKFDQRRIGQQGCNRWSERSLRRVENPGCRASPRWECRVPS